MRTLLNDRYRWLMFDHCGVANSGLRHAMPIKNLLSAVIVVASYRLLKVVQHIITSTHWWFLSGGVVLS